MGRKKKSNPNKKIISFIVTFLMMATGVYYYGLNYVPQKWYEFFAQNIMKGYTYEQYLGEIDGK